MDGASAEPDDESVAGGRAGRPGPALERETMERRKFVIGLGALAAGSSAAVGTGALTAAELGERDVDIAVSSDENALVGLRPGDSDLVDLNDDQLEISFDADNHDVGAGGPGTGDGVNPDSTYQIGDIGDDAIDSLYVFTPRTISPLSRKLPLTS